jgi:hypothetical protein
MGKPPSKIQYRGQSYRLVAGQVNSTSVRLGAPASEPTALGKKLRQKLDEIREELSPEESE